MRPSEGGSEMKGRGLVLHEPTRTGAALSLTTAGCRDRAGRPWQGACGHQVLKQFTKRQVLLWGLTPGQSGELLRPGFRQWVWGTQAGCCTAYHDFYRAHTHTWGHTQIDKCQVQTWTHLCISKHKQGLRPTVLVRDLRPLFSSPGTLTAPLRKPQTRPAPHQPVQQKTTDHSPG